MSSPSKGPVEVSRNWPCPVCSKTVFTATGPSEEAATAKLTVKRTNHIRQRHKDRKHAFGPHTQIRKRVVIPELFADIPMDQRDWSCPMPRCNMGLGSMSSRWARDLTVPPLPNPFLRCCPRFLWHMQSWCLQPLFSRALSLFQVIAATARSICWLEVFLFGPLIRVARLKFGIF